MSDLLPCPFCGATAEHYHRKNSPPGFFQNDVDYWVSCEGENCCAQMGYYDSAASAIAAWNTRAPSGWQDVATAPNDGRTVDLWSSRGGRHPNAAWGVVDYRPVGDPRPDAYGWTDSEGHGSINASGPFTHWMPLPEPPK